MTLAKYRTFKSIRRNLFTEAIRPQRDLKPFITPLMTSLCQHAEFTRWQGHLHLHVLSITFQCVTIIFAPFLPQGHFPLFSSNGFAHLTFFFFFFHTAKADCGPTLWLFGRSDTTPSTFGRWNRMTRETLKSKNRSSLYLCNLSCKRKLWLYFTWSPCSFLTKLSYTAS